MNRMATAAVFVANAIAIVHWPIHAWDEFAICPMF